MIWINAFANMVMTFCALWLLASPKRTKIMRVTMAVVASGTIANIIGMFWFSNIKIWPGELIENIGMAFLLAWYIYKNESLASSVDKVVVKE